ncbi:hypothetical protein [Calothrix sp. PCC 6303]|uniref:hypothetical protein n=1 Tax=Calothrix sp. PCC 6303 TaxID=1170562 RepID=UPI0002A04270|nr:hypothetical protein [Calothrix sp. PCC 6303]AFZ00144.1 hypothetical protein Cal6303_1081 [Calothrix sp. PCC 6303]
MLEDTNEDEDIDVEKLIGYQVEIRNYIDSDTKKVIKGEMTGFSKSNKYVNVKTSDGEQLNKVKIKQVYIYIPEC